MMEWGGSGWVCGWVGYVGELDKGRDVTPTCQSKMVWASLIRASRVSACCIISDAIVMCSDKDFQMSLVLSTFGSMLNRATACWAK